MATFVLVHGAWQALGAGGGSRGCSLVPGNDVFAPTLTGLCERSHLLTPAVDLDTHILDIVNELKWEELKDGVIVGHSYGGMVISGVAEKMEKAIASFVMLDAFIDPGAVLFVDLKSFSRSWGHRGRAAASVSGGGACASRPKGGVPIRPG